MRDHSGTSSGWRVGKTEFLRARNLAPAEDWAHPASHVPWFSVFGCLFAVLCGALTLVGCQKETGVLLAKGTVARLPIVIAPESAPEIRQSAEMLGLYLERISGAQFEIREGGEGPAIFLGTADQFPDLAGDLYAASSDKLRREAYGIRTVGGSLYVIGATALGVDHAVWDLLYRLGYRQYFPGEEWEIIPKKPVLAVEINTYEEPDYVTRSIWFGFGTWKDNAERFSEWNRKNRMSYSAAGNGFTLNTGHAYDALIHKYQKEIEANPGILSEVNGKATNKLNAANPKTQELVVRAKSEQVQKLRDQGLSPDSVSMDPSDGGGWGQSPEELALGTISDRVVLLANRVAESLQGQFGDIYVGVYAYNEHAPAPKIQRLHPNVVVSFATAFIKGNHTLTENIAAWKGAGLNMFGIRDYFSVYAWDADKPAFPKASHLGALAKNIRFFHKVGARFYSAESSDNWGPGGLGYYLAARLLWDTRDPLTPDALISEFVQNCFPEARAEMEMFYRKFLHAPKRINVNRTLLGDMFRQLDAAFKKTKDLAARKRLQSLILYTVHLENLLRLEQAAPEDKQKRTEEALRFSWRIRNTGMVHSLAQWRSSQSARNLNRSKIQIPAEAMWNVEAPTNPWKDDRPFTQEEIQSFLQEGIANNPRLEITRVDYSRDLIPADSIPGLDQPASEEFRLVFRGTHPIHTRIENPADPLEFRAAAGQIYGNLGEAKFSLFFQGEGSAPLPIEDDTSDEIPLYEPAADQAGIPPDKEAHAVTLRAQKAGHHVLLLKDRGAGTRIEWPTNRHFTVEYSLDRAPGPMYRYRMVFYVPRGTKILGGFATGGGRILNAQGETKMQLSKRSEYFKIPVQEAEAGSCWTFEAANGTIQLMTVPPYMAPSASQLLLPREVVEADSK